MSRLPQISDAEWDVMKIVWKQPGCTAAHVIETLEGRRQWGPATVKTLLNRLVRKGALSFDQEGNAYRYTAAHSEDEMRQKEARHFLDRVFDGGLAPFMAHFVRTGNLSEAELAQLEEILKRGRKGR